ncbi:hypothetical protein NLI96_g7163 [Meripilus lineatus]|uniref:Uncharacterized protein n=1 Tax=Meripilus lineatus TaxID=2056292 RepID=A0AAD5UZW9_9APHY|nr:hypothetical protein NLI96_g7163 [Physisporinus lineatus]
MRGEREGGATEVRRLVEEHERVRREMEEGFKAEVEELKKQVEKSGKDSEEAAKTAKYLAEELSRLRRMMRVSVSQSSIPEPVVRPPTSPSSGAPL